MAIRAHLTRERREMTEDRQRRLDEAEWVLQNAGFRRCDIAACNCGSWHQVGGFKARFDEIKEAVEDAGYSTNGKLLLDVVREVAEKAWQYDLLCNRSTTENAMSERTQEDRYLDLEMGKQLERKDAEIMWLRSSLVSLWVLARAENSPLTNAQVEIICKHMLDKYPPN